MRNFLLIAILFFTVRSYATTITVFSEANGQCRYVLADDNAKPIATWAGDCLENLTDAKTIDIAEGTTLWKEIKKLDASLNLKNIKVINARDESVIAKLKALSIPVLNVDKHAMTNFLTVNDASNEYMEKQEAQDYNSSRSNKANSIATVNNSDTSGSNKTNSIATAQDYNSSRSNKANSIAPAQDYNSSRSNKAGIIVSVGMAFPDKNSYMKNGWVFNAGYHIPVKNNFSIEVGIDFWSNRFSYSPSSLFPKEYKNAIEESINNKRWNNLTLSAGPSLMIGKGKYNVTIYTKAAVMFTKIPPQTIGGDNPGAVFEGDKTSVAFNPGLRLNYSMNSQLRLFINPEFLTSLNKKILYREKNILKATDADGKFNPDTYNSLPLTKKYMGIHPFGMSAGIKINLSKR
ncbi:MAG: hypothetical protein ABI237_13215 [Ginsengibacter sp.]